MLSRKFSRLDLSRSFVPLLGLCLASAAAAQQPLTAKGNVDPRAWLRKVRIAAYPVSTAEAERIVQQATESHVYGIEVDNDIPGRYESLLHPEQKLDALRKVSAAAHRHGNKIFVYVAGTECISTEANSAHTLAKEHPDWLQRNKAGDPAIFDNKAAFWIAKGEEDAWVSPYAASWRKLYMQRIHQIAATGVDGIYVDIPYWMTHFTHWEDTWASFDDATVEAFHRKTGLDAHKDIDVGNFDDPGFQKWVDFRIATLTDFLAEIRSTAAEVNPNISLIPEIFPGIESEAPRVGSDVYQIYGVADAIAHEYEFGAGDDHTAASRPPFDWMMYQIGMRSFRAFAGTKPTWMLNYSWDGAPHVPAADAMLTLFASELMAGTNVWDASGHVMSGSNDLAVRKRVFAWIAAHEDIFGAVQTPVGDVGVYFSDTTRNRHPEEFVASYRGALLVLLQTHRQFRIVTPRTLAAFKGTTLVLPSVHELDATERVELTAFSQGGGRLVTTGYASPDLTALENVQSLPSDPTRGYADAALKDYAAADPTSMAAFTQSLPTASSAEPQVLADKSVAVRTVQIAGRTYLFLANFTGIVAGQQLTPTTQREVQIDLPVAAGTQVHVLPFLGTETIKHGVPSGNKLRFTLPPLERGAVVWFQ